MRWSCLVTRPWHLACDAQVIVFLVVRLMQEASFLCQVYQAMLPLRRIVVDAKPWTVS